ncbi:MAG: hypothetical protein E7Z89_07790 [Cyanobacteria bacterium SIG28]|nr:hypothetical protein [Cyanobacteria bacterium SIG28]
MKINPIQQNNNQNFKGKIKLINLKNDLFKEDYNKLVELNTRILKEQYDITLIKNSFGQFITKINHDNSNSIELKPLSFQHYNQTIPEFIESLMNLIDLKKQ